VSWKQERRRQEPRDHGAAKPANAAPGTIRKEFACNIERNSVHGCDSAGNAVQEIAFDVPGKRDRRLVERI
jgi:nucleoside diphosphate kinase